MVKSFLPATTFLNSSHAWKCMPDHMSWYSINTTLTAAASHDPQATCAFCPLASPAQGWGVVVLVSLSQKHHICCDHSKNETQKIFATIPSRCSNATQNTLMCCFGSKTPASPKKKKLRSYLGVFRQTQNGSPKFDSCRSSGCGRLRSRGLAFWLVVFLKNKAVPNQK